MKLLFDENLSWRSPGSVRDLSPSSIHVREIGYKSAEDSSIADYAMKHGYVVVTKDHDLQEFALTSHPELRVVLLQVGNVSAEFVESLLRRHATAIESLVAKESSLRILIIEK